MSTAVSIDPASLPAEEVARLLALVPDHQHSPTPGSRCAACNRLLEEVDMTLVGYASGLSLGLCRKCGSEVNTPAAIAFAQANGHEVHGGVILPPPARAAKKGDEGDEWEGV